MKKLIILITAILMLLSLTLFFYFINQLITLYNFNQNFTNNKQTTYVQQSFPKKDLVDKDVYTPKKDEISNMSVYNDNYKDKIELKATIQVKTNEHVNKLRNTPLYQKVVYLTIDDGPSTITYKILDILKKYDVKATFFVVGTNCLRYPEILKRIVSNGHAIGNHSFSHKYSIIYKDPDSFYQDFKKAQDTIFNITGVKPTIMRFPGGSSGKITPEMLEKIKELGLVYFDWNAITGDANPKLINKVDVNTIISTTFRTIGKQNKVILLLHDSPKKPSTVEALPFIIEKLKNNGYHFDILSKNVVPIQFQIKPKVINHSVYSENQPQYLLPSVSDSVYSTTYSNVYKK